MQLNNIPIIIFIPALLIIPTVLLLFILLFKNIKTRLTMLVYLAILYSFYLINHILQIFQFFAITQESAEFFFIITKIIQLSILYYVILVFDMFYKNMQFSGKQTITTVLAFIIIGELISHPDLNIQVLSSGFSIGFQRFSIIIILETIFAIIATFYILIILIKSLKSAWLPKQKKLIIWLLIGSLIGILLLLLPSVVIEQTLVVEETIYFSMLIIQTTTRNIGILMIGIAFLSVRKNPWLFQHKRVYFLIVYSQNGITLYLKTFSEEMKLEDSVLLARVFSAVSSLIKESTNTSEKVKVILLEGKELRLISRDNFICAFLVEYTTQASKWAQNEFTLGFKMKYKEKLRVFVGEISAFDSADKITHNYFS